MFYIIYSSGRFTSSPFENRINDTPMTSLCRTIEIDAREMQNEKEIPSDIQPINIYNDGKCLW